MEEFNYEKFLRRRTATYLVPSLSIMMTLVVLSVIAVFIVKM